MQSFYFLCWNDCVSPMTNHTFIHTIPLYRYEGGGVAQLPYIHQKTQLSHSVAPSKQSDGCASLVISIPSPQQPGSYRLDNVKGGCSDITFLSASLCCCNSSTAKYLPQIRSEPMWESRPDVYTGKIELLQVKHYCDWDCNLLCVTNLRPEEHMNKYLIWSSLAKYSSAWLTFSLCWSSIIFWWNLNSVTASPYSKKAGDANQIIST